MKSKYLLKCNEISKVIKKLHRQANREGLKLAKSHATLEKVHTQLEKAYFKLEKVQEKLQPLEDNAVMKCKGRKKDGKKKSHKKSK